MADFVFNIAKGKVAEYAARVNANDPTNSVLVVMPINATATDGTMEDYDDFNALLGDPNVTEASWGGRKTIDDTGSITVTTDDTNDRVAVDMPDQTWTSVAASNDSTDLVIGYDSDSTGGTDANIIPCTLHDFAVTTDGSDVTVQFSSSPAAFYTAT